jgi:DNA-binding response OmpR family regulator
MRILIAEDERDLNNILTTKLTDAGYSVDSCLDGREAILYLQSTEYDLAVLDIMMPGADGFEVLASLRRSGKKTPVLFLTARDSIQDRVRGLDAGANDYLVKPFSLEELMARIRVLTRTAHGVAQNLLTAGDLSMDIGSREVLRGGKRIELSAKEYQLLEYLLHNKGIALTREKIENHIWNFDYEGGTNVVDVYISYLRRKIDAGQEQKLIRTVRGVGYMLKDIPGTDTSK